MEEQRWIQENVPKLVLGTVGPPLTDPAVMVMCFPSECPSWDYNMTVYKDRLKVYCQTLLAGLKIAARKATNLTKIYDIKEGSEESLASYLERLMMAFRQFTLFDPECHFSLYQPGSTR